MSYQILNILDSILGIGKMFSKGEHYYYCPLCHHHRPKLAVNINKRKWQCWKCGARGGTLLSLFRKLNVSREQITELSQLIGDEVTTYKEEDVQISLTLPSEFKLLSDSNSYVAKIAKQYIYNRDLNDYDILKYQIGYCEDGIYRNRIIVPSYDESGVLNYFATRDFTGKSTIPNLLPPITKNVIGFEFYLNLDYPIIITEGVFDAMAVKRNTVPLFGKTMSKKLKQKIIEQGVKDVYLVLDNDALKDTLRHAEWLMKEGVNVYVVELYGKDPSELGFVATQQAIRKSEPLTFSKLMEMKMRLV